jgi:hypothetical protein
VTSTEKAKGRRLAKRLTSTPVYSRRLLSEPLLESGERRVARVQNGPTFVFTRC